MTWLQPSTWRCQPPALIASPSKIMGGASSRAVLASMIGSVAGAGQTVGIKQTDDRIWLVSFMDYDLGYFDDETCRLEPLANPFGPKVLPMSSV